MKILSLVAAALVAATGVAAVPAAAQDRTVVRERTTVGPVAVVRRTVVRERNDAPMARSRVVVREHSRVRHAYGYGHRSRKVCTVRFRHGQRIRTCRTMYGRY